MPLRIPDDRMRLAVSNMRREGYLHIPPPDWAVPLRAMVDVVRWLAAQGAPPVLAYHFDEFWMMFARLRPLLCALLGDDPVMLPEFWAWHIDPLTQEAGWAPHRDRGHTSLLPDGSPRIVTLWLPLTDATPLNGCMYIVPADRDPTYGTPEEWRQHFTLADIRALPAPAGSVLGWNQAVLHWGSRAAERDVPPRVSIACEFQRRDVELYNPHGLDPRQPPDFATRQRFIAQQLLRYQHMVHLDTDWQVWAERVINSVPGGRSR